MNPVFYLLILGSQALPALPSLPDSAIAEFLLKQASDLENKMQDNLKNASTFAVWYIVPMTLTYLLPYLGSNSALLNLLTLGLNPFFWIHVFCAAALIAVSAIRGRLIGKESLVMYPVMAMIFDFAPLLNLIPFVPTAFHIAAIAVGTGQVLLSNGQKTLKGSNY